MVREQQERFDHEKSFLGAEPLQLSFFESDLFDEDNYITVARPIRVFSKTLFMNLTNATVVKEGE